MSVTTTRRMSFTFPTNLGWMAVAANGKRLVRLTFGHPSAAAAVASLDLAGEWTVTDRRDLDPAIADLVERLQRYAAGEAVSFADVAVDLSHLTEFQQRVVRHCRKIIRGRTRTYGELAAAAGNPGAARAVGSVMSKNRLPIVVPCHRVVGSAGSLGGFSAPDGLCMKERMLALEGAMIAKGIQTRRTQRAQRGKLVSAK
jgi:methylated-DNA-[protein]-cysteine S-methyltransferase